MTSEDIATIELALGFPLPKAYVDVVTNYPRALAETEAPDFGLFDDASLVIDANRLVRNDGYFGEQWPDQYVIIGENGCGDYYVVMKNANQFSVGFADHEAMECNPFASDLEEFVGKLLVEQNGGQPSGERAPPMTRFLKSWFLGGGPVNAAVPPSSQRAFAGSIVYS